MCEGFMTSHTINVFNRQNTTAFTHLEAKIITNGLKWPYVQLCYHHLTSLFAVLFYIIMENSVR